MDELPQIGLRESQFTSRRIRPGDAVAIAFHENYFDLLNRLHASVAGRVYVETPETHLLADRNGRYAVLMRTLLRDVGGTYVPRVIAPAFDSMLWRLPKVSAGIVDKVAALTFDDGPTPGASEQLLDVLSEFDVPATHFVLGENAEASEHLINAMVQAGHEVGNHSWSHIDCWKSSMQKQVREFRRTDELLTAMTGQATRWVRPPFGKFTYPLIHWARRRDQRVVLWDTMPPDYSERADQAYVGRVLMRLRPRSIVCLHDNVHSSQFTPAALRETLPRLLDDGWRFVRLSDAFATTAELSG